jgi:hypothetical protein
VLQNHHTTNKLCVALAAYAKAVIEKLGPSFLERVRISQSPHSAD